MKDKFRLPAELIGIAAVVFGVFLLMGYGLYSWSLFVIAPLLVGAIAARMLGANSGRAAAGIGALFSLLGSLALIGLRQGARSAS